MTESPLSIEFTTELPRKCGTCQLCCKLLPVKQIGKPAGVRCRHQAHAKGCRVYNGPAMPSSCHMWSCAWLTGQNTGHRPDRAHYVVDIMPDYITLRDNATGEGRNIQVVQVWCDPSFPDAHRDPGLRAYLLERGKDGVAALVRYDNARAFALFPPNMSSDDQWHEMDSGGLRQEEHSLDDIVKALA